jgi:uncharacterized protein
MMAVKDLIHLTEVFVKENLKDYDSGHDWWHIERVRKLSAFINKKESLADPFIVDITALLHDTADSKFKGSKIDGYKIISEFLVLNGMQDIQDRVLEVIKNISFSNKNKTEGINDPLLWVIQDADRLDAIGAIGVARAFNYGGFRNNRIYNPEDNNEATTIKHFYEKLLLLKGMLNTETGKILAIERHEFLEIFLKQFYEEWNFTSGSL